MLSRLLLLSLASAACAVRLPTRLSSPQRAGMESMPTRRSMLASAASLALLQQLPMAAHAEVRGANSALVNAGEKEVNKFLTNNGFPAMKVPGGLSPLALYIGLAPPANIDGSKTKERYFKSTLLVRFLYPSGWLVETPSITENGEAGKIAANNYLKGDAADFVSLPKPKGKGLADLDKASPTNESNTFLTYGGNGVRHMGKRGLCRQTLSTQLVEVSHRHFGVPRVARSVDDRPVG